MTVLTQNLDSIYEEDEEDEEEEEEATERDRKGRTQIVRWINR